MGYGDQTWCGFWKQCKHGKECGRAITKQVEKKAEAWWGDKHYPIAMYADKPTKCFMEK